MIEATLRLPYHITMKWSSLTRILRQSTDNLLDSLDLRQRSEVRVLAPGETVEAAWRNTGTHLRKAMDYYGPVSSQTSPRSRH